MMNDGTNLLKVL